MNLKKKMIVVILFALTSTILLFGCRTQTLEEASASYKKNGDIKSIEILFKQLKKGMTKERYRNCLMNRLIAPAKPTL